MSADIDDYYRARDPKPLLFCHFAAGHGGDASYDEVADFKRLQRTLGEGLAEYNDTNAGGWGAAWRWGLPGDWADGWIAGWVAASAVHQAAPLSSHPSPLTCLPFCLPPALA